MNAAKHAPGWRIEITGHPEGAGGQRCYLTAEGGAIAQLYPCANPRRALGDAEISDMPEAFMGPIMKRNADILLVAPQLLVALTQLAFMARTSGSPTPELLRACEGAEALIAKTGGCHG